ncbi:hypothetical protein [Paenibacillus illinoisensis]|uniref:hypothetical protein n=1 Tax=Paenibacillus illinoisensis TaxID=59845 RepID=UPI00301D974E
MYQMQTDEKGNFITVACVRCYTDVRVECKDETELTMWNEDLLDGVGTGVYVKCETRCSKCEKAMMEAEEYFIKRDDVGYQLLTYDGDK